MSLDGEIRRLQRLAAEGDECAGLKAAALRVKTMPTWWQRRDRIKLLAARLSSRRLRERGCVGHDRWLAIGREDAERSRWASGFASLHIVEASRKLAEGLNQNLEREFLRMLAGGAPIFAGAPLELDADGTVRPA